MFFTLNRAAVLSLLLFLVVVLSVDGFCQAKGGNQPEFYLPKTSVNVGTHYEGANINFTFKVRNRGKGILKIVNVKPG